MNSPPTPSHRRLTTTHRRTVAALFAAALAVLVMVAMPTFAATRIERLPDVVDFSSARFDVLITLKADDEKQILYGQGETVRPDRVKLGVTSDNLDRLIYVVQVGDTTYTNSGDGWTESVNETFVGAEPVSVAEELALIQANADGVLNMGDTTVRGVAVTQYQAWLSGKRLLNLIPDDEVSEEERDIIESVTYKYDFWIGKQDNVLYQQTWRSSGLRQTMTRPGRRRS